MSASAFPFLCGIPGYVLSWDEIRPDISEQALLLHPESCWIAVSCLSLLTRTCWQMPELAKTLKALPLLLFSYKHVDNCMHILKDQIHLRHRPWHFKLRFNIADHMVARYNAGEPTVSSCHQQAQPVISL